MISNQTVMAEQMVDAETQSQRRREEGASVGEQRSLISKRYIEPNSPVTREHAKSLLTSMQQRSSFAVDAKYEELCQEKSLMNKWARDKVNASK